MPPSAEQIGEGTGDELYSIVERVTYVPAIQSAVAMILNLGAAPTKSLEEFAVVVPADLSTSTLPRMES